MRSPRATKLATSLFAALLLAACDDATQPEQAAAMEVDVIVAEPQSVPLTRELVGRLSATRSADVRARVAGVLLRRLYEEGSDVKAGQILFQIDPTPMQAELDRALASLARAQAEATNAKVVADRARKLVVDGLLPQQDVDNAAAAERSTAAAVKQAQAEVQSAQIRLGYARVVAPISGRAGQQRVTEGALVGETEATLLTTVEQIDPLYVNFDQPADMLMQLQRAQSSGGVTLVERNTARVQLLRPDGTAAEQSGVVDFSGASVDPATGTVAFRGVIPNPNRQLLPGMFVNVRLTLGQRNNVFLVPQVAVLRDTGGAYVWTVGKDGKPMRKSIQAEAMRGSDWIVSDGIAQDDRIIVEGASSIRPTSLVKAVPVTHGSSAPGAVSATAAPR